MSKPKPLSFHVGKFSDKVRTMNDSNSKSLMLTAEEARNLHTDIFALLTKIAELSDKPKDDHTIIGVMDSGGF
jgi:hypothetical protein